MLFLLLPLLFLAICLIGNYDGSRKTELRRYIPSAAIWMACILLGIAIQGRYYPQYQIPLVAPLVLFYCSWLYTLQSKLRRFAIVFAFSACMCWAGALFIENVSFHPSEQLVTREAKLISKFIRENTRQEDTIFLLENYNLNIFYLSERLSPNGIYMYIDMEAKHTNDPMAEAKFRERLRNNLPKVIVRGPGPRTTYPVKDFVVGLINEHYELRAEIAGAEIYFRSGS
jgi:hypothetical protein